MAVLCSENRIASRPFERTSEASVNTADAGRRVLRGSPMPDVRFRAPAEKRTRACDRRRARDGAGENQFSGFRATLFS